MQDSPLISVIVPIYKVEPYLRRCLDSIVNQTYTNLEIILVDDGSPDGCPAICDEYAVKDSRIIVIHKENGGLSDARNAGLDICKGEYISFVDSDDWIASNFIEILLNNILENNAELAITQYITAYSSVTSNIGIKNNHTTIFSPLEATKKLWSNEETTFVTAWGKLYKKSLWQELRFPKGLLHEDEYTAYKVLYTANKTIFLSIPLYYYFQRSDSIMAGIRPSSIRVLKARLERYEYFKKKEEPEIIKLCLKNLCWDLLFAYSQPQLNNNSTLEFYSREELLAKFKKTVNHASKTKSTNGLYLFFLKIFAKCPSLYLIYRKISPVHIRNI